MLHSVSLVRGWIVLIAAGLFAAPAASAPMQADAFQSSVVADPGSGAFADQVDEVTITVTVRDAAGQPLSGRIVRVDSSQLDDLIAQPVEQVGLVAVTPALLVIVLPKLQFHSLSKHP